MCKHPRILFLCGMCVGVGEGLGFATDALGDVLGSSSCFGLDVI